MRDIDISKALGELRDTLGDPNNFPITASRWNAIFGVDPSEFGRGADIYLNGDQMGQDGQPSDLNFKVEDLTGEVGVTISVGRQVTGTRTVYGDTIQWVPSTATAPVVKFSRQDIQAILGGKISQMQISRSQLTAANPDRCLAVRFGPKP